MLRPEGSDPATIAASCASGSTTRRRAGATRRRWRSARTASAGGCTRPPAPSSRRRLRRRDGRGDRARGRHVEGDVLRALRQQGGLHHRPPRRRHGGRAGGDAPDGRRLQRRATPPAACARSSTRSSRCSRRSPTRRRRCWSRSSAPDRGRSSGATACSPSTPPTSTRSTARTPSAAARRRLASPHDAFAIVGAVVELASRQIRTGEPDDIRDLEPVVERLVLGLLRAADGDARVSAATGARRARGAVHECRRCPRLVAWREQVAREKRAAFRDETYWGRPVAGFGDPRARVLLLGLAPAAHGANRTGPHVHRRPLGRLPVRRAAPHRLREPAGLARTATTGWRCATAGSPRRCAARRRPTSRCRRSATTARTGCAPSWRCSSTPARRRLPRRVRLGGRPSASSRPALRPRPRFGHGAEAPLGDADAARLLPPQPAEHVHRPADARR